MDLFRCNPKCYTPLGLSIVAVSHFTSLFLSSNVGFMFGQNQNISFQMCDIKDTKTFYSSFHFALVPGIRTRVYR